MRNETGKIRGRCDLKFSFLASVQMTVVRTRRERWVPIRLREGEDSYKSDIANSKNQLAPNSKYMNAQ